MEIINLAHSDFFFYYQKKSCAVRLMQTKDVLLFNCCEGCQHSLMQNSIKISQIFAIIISDLHADSISGLLGLLSSLSLVNRKKALHIYGPLNIDKYINLVKKYSRTNFCYSIRLHILQTGLVVNNFNYRIYAFISKKYSNFILVTKEKNGRFLLSKAEAFHLIAGPLYGRLKQGVIFLLPDGFVFDGLNFASLKYVGIKITFLMNHYNNRRSIEISSQANMLYYLY